MAGRRVMKSAVDWIAFAERVPPNQVECFRAFKQKSEFFVSKVHRHPEKSPVIDFEFYKSKLPNPALVVEFEKSYKALAVPYPKDKANMKATVDKAEKEAQVLSKQYVAEAQKTIEEAKAMLSKIDSLPPPEVMTYEMFADYFPELCLDPWNRPTFFPHNKSHQPQYDPHYIN